MPEDLDSSPGMEPPAGQASHFNSPFNSLQIGIFVAFGITYLAATVCVGLRYFQAFKLIRKVEVDLIAISISYGLAAAYFATIVQLFKYGWGKHLWDVTKAQLMGLNKVTIYSLNLRYDLRITVQAILPNTLCYLICPAVTKLAILSVLYRINPSYLYRYTVIAMAIAIFAYTLTLCIMIGGPCSPLKDGTLKCLEDVLLANAVLNIASDIAVVATPLPTIHHLRLPLKQKASVGCLLALGSGVLICSLARLPYVIRLGHQYNRDSSWTQAILGTWSIVELNLGVICACLMRFKPLIRTYVPWLGLFSSRTRSRTTRRRTYEYGSSRRWRSGHSRGKQSYQMHSVQRGNGEGAVLERGNIGDISVYREFNVDVDGDGDVRRTEGGTWYKHGDGESMDNILN
ncbi:uncharacterized protein BDV17DRAFT_293250 [Aspergillus undulatus]|uniref:uncharacterized protein n=1 Tax=Aspergillus undulatus TaxID=1810928 RepID=UPI003CCD0D4E